MKLFKKINSFILSFTEVKFYDENGKFAFSVYFNLFSKNKKIDTFCRYYISYIIIIILLLISLYKLLKYLIQFL